MHDTLRVCVVCADLKPSGDTLDILAAPTSHPGAREACVRNKSGSREATPHNDIFRACAAPNPSLRRS